MAFPVYQTADTATTVNTSGTMPVAVNLPSNISAGDLLLMVSHGSITDFYAFAATGWTVLDEQFTTNNVGHSGVLAKVATGSEGSTVDLTSGVSGDHLPVIVIRISDWFGSLAGVEISTAVKSSGTTADPGSLTPSWGSEDTLWLAIASNDVAVGEFTGYPTDYSIGQATTRTATTEGGAVAIAGRELATTVQDPGAFTNGNARWIAWTLAVRPSAATGPTIRQALQPMGAGVVAGLHPIEYGAI